MRDFRIGKGLVGGLAVLLLACASGHALARPLRNSGGGLVITAAFGGAVPSQNIGGDSVYVIARLGDAEGLNDRFTIARASPFLPQTKAVWDSRPQMALGARYDIGRIENLGEVSVGALVCAAVEYDPAERRPMVGVASLRVSF
ncbi:Hypothetical protein ADP8_02917 [Roseomonas mucosa]|uniref:Uncharacterized protein n=1 Tax=Roseomonas mucosa TaxID=207340 RepID=A0A379N2I5_9PROT|nr:Hypothetical protein ADP8_02917 [Roseomonas mucosa]SUE41567.1 Uncharacterised protein [Roseomonas mucosa]